MYSRSLPLALFSMFGMLCHGPQMGAQTPSPQLAGVLAQMDASSRNFRSATAEFEWDIVEKVANITDTSKQQGSMFIAREKSGTAFGATVFDIGEDGKKAGTPADIIAYNAGSLQVYKPAEKQEDLFKSGANGSGLESYLSLGFGGSGYDLAQKWQITDGGPETLTEDGHPVKTEKLVLVSKDPAVRNNIQQVALWIDPTRDISIKQVFEASDTQRTAYYRNVRLNETVNRDPFKIPSKGVTVVPH